MTYNKPEVVKLDSAVKAIQSHVIDKNQLQFPDARQNQVLNATPAAYESDE